MEVIGPVQKNKTAWRARGSANARATRPLRRHLWLAACITLIAAGSASATTTAPILVSELTSTRAIALESVTLTREPFALTSPVAWGTDQRTRIMLFAVNLTLLPGEDQTAVTADAEDNIHGHHAFTVECVSAVPGLPWLTQVVMRLSDDLTDPGDMLIRITYQSLGSNRVRVGIHHLGGGPVDDPGAGPTPVPGPTIGGRVSSAGGTGVAGVTVTLGGSQIGATTSDSAGNYSFTALAYGGTYTVTPSIEQDYYTFSPPNRNISSLVTNQIGDFSATLLPVPNPQTVLEFDGAPKTVDYNLFWPEGVNLGHFFWEFWAMPAPGADGTYLLSDGYGGAHALLFGVGNINSYEPGRFLLFGNIFDGTNPTTNFASDQGPAPGEWGHFAVGWDGQSIITYFNGVPVGKTSFAGPRRTPGPGLGGGRLLIGGSDHSNFVGRIAQVHGYEGSNPREDPTGMDLRRVETSFAPATVFTLDGNLLSYYFRSAPRVADLSTGYNGTHSGKPRGTTLGILADCGPCPPPQFVVDPTAPNFATLLPSQPVAVPTPPAIPGGALVFDSFSRANSTYTFGGLGGLGSTEGGTAGIRVWQTSQAPATPQPFGILNGRGVLLANSSLLTWVTTGSSTGNLDVRVDRHAGVWGSGLDTGLSFRVTDAANYFFAYTIEGTHGRRFLTVGYYQNGQRTDLQTGLVMPEDWVTLRVVTTNNGDIKAYADATLVYSANSSVTPNASGAGLYNNSSGMGLVNRWDNFAVFAAP